MNSFNSTLVQLKDVLQVILARRKQSFNSTLVQLKVFNCSPRVGLQLCFNSTLVQLKETYFSVLLPVLSKFQFYLSSIKRSTFKSNFNVPD